MQLPITEGASLTSENAAEHEAVESAVDLSAKAVAGQLIDELVGQAQPEGLELTGEGGLLQQRPSGCCSPSWRARPPTTQL